MESCGSQTCRTQHMSDGDVVQDSLLLNLPQELLEGIAQWATPLLPFETCHPLLRVSRGTRDAIFSGHVRFLLDLSRPIDPGKDPKEEDAEDLAPTARLLQRICNAADLQVGIGLDLTLTEDHDKLRTLLQPALDCGGWLKVYYLKVSARNSLSLNLLAPAFPALRQLVVDLNHASLWEGELLTALETCTGLSAIAICNFTISAATAATPTVASALSHLPNLEQVLLTASDQNQSNPGFNPASLVSGVTGLAALQLVQPRTPKRSTMFAAAAANTGLQALHVGGRCTVVPPACLKQALTSCRNLTQLDLGDDLLYREALEVILTHGTNITSISAGAMCPGTKVSGRQSPNYSMANRACRWEEVTLTSQEYSSVEHLAFLPLGKVMDLTLGHTKEYGLGLIELPLLEVSTRRIPSLVKQAATNLAATPAWKKDPPSVISIWGDPSANTSQLDKRFTPPQRVQLFEALEPLAGPHVKEVSVCIEGIRTRLGEPEMKVIGRLFGQHLTTFTAGWCDLPCEFWCALDTQLPHLRNLSFGDGAHCDDEVWVLEFCILRPPTMPHLLFQLNQRLYKEWKVDDIKEEMADEGLSHITFEVIESSEEEFGYEPPGRCALS